MEKTTKFSRNVYAKRRLSQCQENIPTLSRLGEIIKIERNDDSMTFFLGGHIVGIMYRIPKKNNTYSYTMRISDSTSLVYDLVDGWIRKVDWFETSHAQLAQYIIFGHKWLVQKAIDLNVEITQRLFEVIDIIVEENHECSFIENELSIRSIMEDCFINEQGIDYEIVEHYIGGTSINIWDSQKGFDETAKKIFIPNKDTYWSIISHI